MSIYRWDSIVRDYELDMQGIVNHATYINYLEVCRSNYARSAGVDVVEYHQRGYDLVITHITVQYKQPLRAQEHFYVTASMSPESRIRLNFDQEIRKNDDSLVLTAKVTCVCIESKSKKPIIPDFLLKAFSLT